MKPRIPFALEVGAIILALVAFGGCDSEDTVASTDTATDASSLVPTLAQVTNAVSLDDDDQSVVAAALAEWRESVGTETKPDQSFRHPRAGIEFVAAVAPSLDNEQLSDLVDFLVDYRESHAEETRRAFREKHGPRALRDGLVETLGLSADQKSAVEAIHEAARAEMRARHEALRAGAIGEEQMEESMRAFHDAQRQKLAAVLTPAQLAKMDELRDEHHAEMIDRRLEHMEEVANSRTDWLTAVLGLSAEQRAAVASAVAALVAERKQALESSRDGAGITAPLVLHKEHEAMAQTLEGILTAEQLERLESVRRLHTRGGRNSH